MPGINDPFPTVRLTVPYLKEMLAKLRDPKAERVIVLFRADTVDQGEWVLQNVAGRLMRGKVSCFGPEPHKPAEIIEQALRMKASVALAGQIRAPEDANAMRAASALGLRIAAFIVAPERERYAEIVMGLGPWRSYNILSLNGDKK